MSTDIASPKGNVTGSSRAPRFRPSSEFLRFIAVGAVAFVINELALFVLYDVLLPHDRKASLGPITHPDASLLIASVIAVEIAIVFKFYAHEHWTFPHRPQPEWAVLRFLKFNASCILSPIITVATVNVLTPVFGISPYISLAIGTVFGFLVNWYFSAYLIWRHRHEHEQVPAA
jgi:putative flippase GtrA